MKMLKSVLFSLLGLLLLGACNSDDENLVNPLDPANQVKFLGTIGSESLRASGTSWDSGDAIGVYALKEGTSLPSGVYNEKENIKYTTPGNGNFTAALSPILFPETGALDFIAYYPYQEEIKEQTYNIDVSNQSNSAAIDVLYSNNAKGASQSNSEVKLEFKHALSLFIINVSVGDGVESLTGLKVVANKLLSEGKMSLADGKITAGDKTQSLTLTPEVEASGKMGAVAAILLPGQELKDVEIVFTLDGRDYKWNPGDVTLASGKKYSYPIQLSTTGLSVLNPGATIVDWEDADTGSGTIILKPEEGEGEGDLLTVAQLRAKHTGANVTITEDIQIKAVVIQNLEGGNSTSKKNIVVQDETGGIAIRFKDNSDLFTFGDEVEISLKDQELSAYNGLLQINNLVNANVKKVGTKSVEAKEITAAQLLSGNYESQYVAVSNVQVAEADLEKTFATDKHGSINMEAQSGETFVMFTASFATFKGEKVPQGSGTLKGIASVNKDIYQILPTVAGDYAGMTGARFGGSNTLTVSAETIEFEAAANDLKEINITASGAWTATTDGSGFSVSPLKGTGNATVTVTASAAEGTAGKIVFTLDGTTVKKSVTVTQKTGTGNSVIFSENFNDLIDGKGGNDGYWAGQEASGEKLPSYKDWTLVEGYKGKESVKLGAGSKLGSAQTPALTGLSGDAVLTFRGAAWNSKNEQTELLLDIEGGGVLSVSSIELEKGAFKEFTVNITGGTPSTKITFKGKQAKNSRFFLDDVVITQK